jgi:glutaredoxin
MKNKRLLLWVLFFISTIAFSGNIYSWKDQDGNVYFGDTPPVVVNSEKIKIRENTVVAPENVKSSAAEYVSDLGKHKPKIKRRKKVVMYSAAWCVVCKRARKYFVAQHVPFREYDIDVSARGRKAYEKYGTSSVPVIVVGRKHMKGFSTAGFERLYAAADQ